MSELSALKVGCGKFFYGKNVLSQLPGEILRLGGKALIVGGDHSPRPMYQGKGRILFKKGTK